MGELALRFVIGGAVVSLFAAIAELFEPKRFAGLFGAAPTIGLATLAFTYADDGPRAAATSGWWMLAGSAAMLAYCACCIAVGTRLPTVATAFGAWLAWFALAAVAWLALHGMLA